jgi:Uma2 family endonuclease
MTTSALASEHATDEEMATSPRPYSIPVELYDRMVASGVFGDTSPIFLWKGQLVLPMTKGPDHGYPLSALHGLLFRLLPEGWHVRQEMPLRLLDGSEPEPDLSVIRGALGDYRRRTPDAQDVSLAVEVADSSLNYDSGEKLRAYAAAGIPVYWVVNIPEQRIDVHTQPSGPVEHPSYAQRQQYSPDEEVPVVLDGREFGRVTVKDVLP